MIKIKDAVREGLEKSGSPMMSLNMWYTFAKMQISIKARKLYKEGCSKEFIEKWREHAENEVITAYINELKKIEESQK